MNDLFEIIFSLVNFVRRNKGLNFMLAKIPLFFLVALFLYFNSESAFSQTIDLGDVCFDCSVKSLDKIFRYSLIFVIYFYLAFAGKIHGRRSIHYVYTPAIVGMIAILFFSNDLKNYWLLPASGLILGWPIYFLIVCFYEFIKYSFEKSPKLNRPSEDLNTPSYISKDNKNQKIKTVYEIESSLSKASEEEKKARAKVKNDPNAVYAVENWTDAALLAALKNKTYQLPVYKETLNNINREIELRGLN